MSKKIDTIIFIAMAKKIHGNKYNYCKSNYKKSIEKIIIICNTCNFEFQQTPNGHLNGSGCHRCGGSLKSDITSFSQKANILHNFQYDYSLVNYTNARTKVKILCKTHGVWEVTPTNHLTGYGCPDCGGSKPWSKSIFSEKGNIIHKSYYNYSKSNFKNIHTKIVIDCPVHGDFEQTPAAHIHQEQGCPKCTGNSSKMEDEWLDYLNIPKSNRLKTIRTKYKTFRVDAFDSLTNTIYEFNGDFWHGNPKKFNSNEINPRNHVNYGTLYQNTVNKEKLLTDAGYTVISIWESDWVKMREMI